MQRFNQQPVFKKRSPLSPAIGKAALLLAGVAVLTLVIRSIVHRAPVLELRAEYAKELLQSKRSLVATIDELRQRDDSFAAFSMQLQLLRDENEQLKSELDRHPHAPGVLARAVYPPSRSLYDTLIIDAGVDDGIVEGQIAYAFDTVALGTISEVRSQSAVVQLFSAPGRQTAATVEGGGVAITLIGRGAGEYEVRMPRDVPFAVGDAVTYQSADFAVMAKIEKITTDPRDPFQRLLAKAPVNLAALKWVIVR